MISMTERFWSKVDIGDASECWPWMRSIVAKGYGQFEVNGKPVRAHRMAYELTVGEIPTGKLVCHTCDNRKCCNPAHLFVGTARDNTRDMVSKGRAKGAAGESNWNARLTAADVAKIRTIHGSNRQLAKMFGVSRVHISRIRSGQKWAAPLAASA